MAYGRQIARTRQSDNRYTSPSSGGEAIASLLQQLFTSNLGISSQDANDSARRSFVRHAFIRKSSVSASRLVT